MDFKKKKLREHIETTFVESIIDFEKTKLNPNIWDDYNKIKPEVRDFILESLFKILSEEGVPDNRVEVVYLEGSNLTFFYTPTSDIDVHFFITDITDEEAVALKEKTDKFNESLRYIPDTNNNVELFRMDSGQLENISGPRYDLLKDEWEKEPEKLTISDDMFKYCMEVSLTYARALDLGFGELKRDLMEYEILSKEIENPLIANIESLKEKLSGKLTEIKSDIDALVMKYNNLQKMRRDAFSGEFDPQAETLFDLGYSDRSYTLYNIVFKILQKFGYIEALKYLKYYIHSSMLKNKDFEDNIRNYVTDLFKVIFMLNKVR